jgi:hypothetical protein
MKLTTLLIFIILSTLNSCNGQISNPKKTQTILMN